MSHCIHYLYLTFSINTKTCFVITCMELVLYSMELVLYIMHSDKLVYICKLRRHLLLSLLLWLNRSLFPAVYNRFQVARSPLLSTPVGVTTVILFVSL